MLKCKILRNFDYSVDGVTSKSARVGEYVSIPANLVASLVAESYIEGAQPELPLTKDAGPSVENKMVKPAVQNKKKAKASK